MKLVISTQVYENYGAHDWDGTGECPQYWKAKGGSDYAIKRFKGGDEEAVKAIFCLRPKIESDDDFYRESILSWNLVDDDYLTEFEQSQLDYEGKIRFPVTELEW
jgi:hypothetical protein